MMPKMIVAPTFTCDICGASIAPEALYSLKVTYAAPGDARLPSMECGEEQHYGCSAEHAREAALRCIDEHLEPGRVAQSAALEPLRAG